MNIGVRDLRDSLSRQLAAVREGHTITVTDHGKPVARIIPVGASTNLERLIAEGEATPGRSRRRPLPDLVQASGIVSDLVAEQRR